MTESRSISASTPVFRVDDDVKSELTRDLTSLEIEENTEGLKTMVARFIGRGPTEGSQEEQDLYLDGETFDFGKKIKVTIGQVSSERTIFEGAMSALEV